MDHHRIFFHSKGKEYTAKAHLSLQEDGCYVFAFLEDDLIIEFGPDVDIETDCVTVVPDSSNNDSVTALKAAILEAVKKLPQVEAQVPKKLLIKATPY